MSSDLSSDKILSLIDADNIAIDKKKRGRPKKTTIDATQQNTQENDDNIANEEIILHLSLTKAEIDAFRNGNTPQPMLIEPTIHEEQKENECSEKINNKPNPAETLDIKSKDVTTLIQKQVARINELSDFIKINMPMYYCKVSAYPIDLHLFERNGKKFIPKPTKICCWHDTEPFDGLPTYLPEKFYNGEFYVFGCFCSFNCACAYNLAKNDGRVLDRHNLLIRMFYEINKKKITSVKDIEINPAGQKELLQKFGGPLSITEFRENAKIMGRTYSELIPSCHPINITYSENTSSKIVNTSILDNI